MLLVLLGVLSMVGAGAYLLAQLIALGSTDNVTVFAVFMILLKAGSLFVAGMVSASIGVVLTPQLKSKAIAEKNSRTV